MGPAVKAQDPSLAFIIVVHGIAVRLERAPEVCEQSQRHVLRTRAFVVMEEKQFLCHSAYLPEVALDRPVLLVVNYRHRRFIGLNVVSIYHQVPYSVIERPQLVSDILEPVHLWIRMALANMSFANLPDVLVNVRVGEEMYQRRGGMKYFKSEAKPQGYMMKHGIISLPRYVYNVAGRFAVHVAMPNKVRSFVFQKVFRK